jgi:ABC transporter substrate binding protein (PQQ-dependent alcohol dehydrogenase system)
MTERRSIRLAPAALAMAAALTAFGAQAQTPAPAPATPRQAPAPAGDVERVPIGYLEIRNDERYLETGNYTGIRIKVVSRPFVGAEVAVDESATTARVIRKTFVIEKAEVDNVDQAVATIERWKREQNLSMVVMDLDATAVDQIGRRTRNSGVMLFNATAADDRLRNRDCQPHVMHTMPSTSMFMDALTQFMVSKRWRNIFVLQGPLPEDALTVASLERSVRRFGARIVEKKLFVPGNDPRQRELNNVALMTSTTSDYDVVFVADEEGEFARTVPYETNRARPVIGATGLMPMTWFWTFERYGSTQVNSRFENKAKRHMTSLDWAVWAATKSIITGVVRSRTADGDKLQAFIKNESFRFDASMGAPNSYRPWNNQMRTPILLSTADTVLEIAPIEGFLHQSNELDTLGEDRPDTGCKF